MSVEHGPVVGHWYHRTGGEQVFQVVAIDETDGSVEIQYFDGTIDELRRAQWHAGIETSEAPQDWTGPFDSIARDDLGATEVDMTPDDWHEPYEPAPVAGGAAVEEAMLETEGALLDPALVEPASVTELLYARPVRARRAGPRRGAPA